MERQLKLKLLPNNQVSIFSQWVNTKREDRFLSRPDYSKLPEHVKEYYRSGQAKYEREKDKTHETIRVPYYKSDGTVKFRLLKREKVDTNRLSRISDGARLAIALDITKKSQRQPRHHAGWGFPNSPKNFSHRAGQRIRECGAMLDKVSGYQPEKARVVTLTLAGDTQEAFQSLSDYSGYAINRIFQPIRTLSREDTYWFFVWEHQRRGALHLHICLYNPDKGLAKECGDRIIEKWLETLADIEKLSGTDMFVRRDKKTYTDPKNYQNLNQEMHKSCGAYFSKYAGKSSRTKENSYVSFYAKKYPPSRFWGSSKNLKAVCRENSYEEVLATGEAIEGKHKDILELILLHNPVKYSEFSWRKLLHEGTEREVVITEGSCQTFYLPKENYFELLNAMKSAT